MFYIVPIAAITCLAIVIYVLKGKKKNPSDEYILKPIEKNHRHNLFFDKATSIAKREGTANINTERSTLIYTFNTEEDPQILCTIIDNIDKKTTHTIVVKQGGRIVFNAQNISLNKYEADFQVFKYIEGSWTNYIFHNGRAPQHISGNVRTKMNNMYQASKG